MSFVLKPLEKDSPELLRELAGQERFVTHAHNPCIVSILHRTFGWEGGTFLFSEDETPLGIFSCMFVNGKIISMPHFSYGGFLCNRPDRKEILHTFIPLVYKYFSGKPADNPPYLIRWGERMSEAALDTKIISWLDIKDTTAEDVIPSGHRAKIRKAREAGLIVKRGGLELLNDFYRVYSRNMLRLGSPVLPLKLFRNILEEYCNGEALLFCAYKQKKPVGTGFLMSFEGFFENTWFSTLQEYNSDYVSYLLHFEMISYACSKGAATYSFGRSTKGSGVHEYKRRWKTEETIMYWNYDKLPKFDLRKADYLASLWRMLTLPLANWLGPVAGRSIY